MALRCEKCKGTAAVGAQSRTFEYEGQTLHCLTFVSSCTVCGYRWTDERYEDINSLEVERACAVATMYQETAEHARVNIG